ncbi:MAG TPA: AAA family ATPase [Desulfuromonadales bacterium]|nr:AAA family ATPase [Desulfuromonadales bacterium]
MAANTPPIVGAMLDPDFYPHPVDQVQQTETHASRVFLAGDFAYKLKKPVDFGFLDFSTPEKRRHFCREELRLNQRFAPQLYLEVVDIGGPAEALRLGGTPVREHAVKMRRFPARQQLDRLHAAGGLTADQMRQFATCVARFHNQAAIAPPTSAYGTPAAVTAPVEENFAQLRPLVADDLADRLINLETWSRQTARKLQPLLEQRKQQGYIREGHGDLHLGNMVWFENKPLLFDCIEFNANLRWIDTINDIAFLIMDLEDRQETELGWWFLNGYLRESGDFAGLPLLNFYKVYRAMVRAKVVSLRLDQAGQGAAESRRDQALVRSYFDLAAAYTTAGQPQLMLTHGLSGSGKSTFAKQFAPLCGAVCVHSDIERKRLHGLAAEADSASEVAAGLYGEEATSATYRHLQIIAEDLLEAGFSVLVDATFGKREQRSAIHRRAQQRGFQVKILDFQCSRQELLRRIEARSAQPGRISEATADVLEHQLAHAEPLSPEERRMAITILPETRPAEVAARLCGTPTAAADK